MGLSYLADAFIGTMTPRFCTPQHIQGDREKGFVMEVGFSHLADVFIGAERESATLL